MRDGIPGVGNHADRAADRLQSWKEIAAYLHCDIRTVQRWEREEGLPVHRHIHHKLSTVYAYREEIEAWWTGRSEQQQQKGDSKTPARRQGLWLALIAALLGVAGVAKWWQLSNRQQPHLTVRRIWVGPDASRIGDISSDGSYLAYVDAGTGNLEVRDLPSGHETQITHKPQASRIGQAFGPVISPDGKYIAYSWDHAYYWDLRIIGVDGSDERVLFSEPDSLYVEAADWSPDGSYILTGWARSDLTHRIGLINVNNGAVRILRTLDWRRPSKMSFSPDGSYVAYDLPQDDESQTRDIFLLEVRPDGREARDHPLVHHPANDLMMGWAPDGRTILFASDRGATFDAWAIRTHDGNPDAEPWLVKKELGLARPMGFTQDGSFYYSNRTGTSDVYEIRLDAASGRVMSAPKRATGSFAGYNAFPDWSPDGRYLAYVPASDPRVFPAKVIIRSLEHDEDRVVPVALQEVSGLRWSPDGRWLALSGRDRHSRAGVFRVSPESGEAATVVQDAEPVYFVEPIWSPDGTKLFYKSREAGVEPSRLLVQDLTIQEDRELLPSVYRYTVCPDGRHIAFTTFDEAGEYLKVVEIRSGVLREIYRQPRTGRIYSVAWTQDEKNLLFARKGELWCVPAAGGPAEKLALVMPSLRDLRVHPDGRRIAFTAGEFKGEVWVMENPLSSP